MVNKKVEIVCGCMLEIFIFKCWFISASKLSQTMMKEDTHLNLNDVEFEKQFTNVTLSPSLFNHEAHLRLAWIYLDKYGVQMAIDKITKQLASFVNALGAKDKYNETLTRAAMLTVYHFKRQSRSKNFIDFILEFPELKFNFKELTGYHYANDVFNSLHESCEFDYLEPERVLVNRD